MRGGAWMRVATRSGSVGRELMKSDAPTKRIVAALREVGASVAYILSRPGRGQAGLPDLLVGFGGRNYLLEVKAEKGQLSSEQILFHEEWRGRRIDVVKNEADALIAIGLVP